MPYYINFIWIMIEIWIEKFNPYLIHWMIYVIQKTSFDT